MKNLFTLCIAFLFIGILSAQTDEEKAAATVNVNTIKSHIYFLADDLLEGRASGTRGNKIAASYLANELRRNGAKPIPGTDSYYQKFNLVQTGAPNFVELSLNGTPYPLQAAFTMPAIDESGEAVFLGYGTEDDFKRMTISGKMVVVLGGNEAGQDPGQMLRSSREKMSRAQNAGAKGLLELVQFDEAMWTRLKHYIGGSTKVKNPDDTSETIEIPHVWINTKTEDPGFTQDMQLSYTLKSDGQTKTTLPTQNVVGMMEGTDPKLKNEYVIYSAHYDHVGIGQPNAEGDSIYNGARDNAIGVTAVLSMLENLGKYPTKRSALFILFTGEEKGLLGSKYYADHPMIPLNQMSYCFNTDGGGYNDTSLATIIGLERTSAQPLIEKGASTFGLKAIGDPAPEQGLFDRSDNVSFAQKGVPAPTYSTGFSSFDDEIFKYYHQAADEADSLDYEYLLKFYQGYVYTGRLIANTSDKLFWNSGDKYEEAGKALYEMK